MNRAAAQDGPIATLFILNQDHDPSIPRLPNMDRAMAWVLDATMHWNVSSDHRQILINPDRAAIEDALVELGNAEPQASHIFAYIYGYGFLDVDNAPSLVLSSFRLAGGTDPALALRRLSRGSIPLQDFILDLRLIGAERSVVVFDACSATPFDTVEFRELLPGTGAEACAPQAVPGTSIIFGGEQGANEDLLESLLQMDVENLFDGSSLQVVFSNLEPTAGQLFSALETEQSDTIPDVELETFVPQEIADQSGSATDPMEGEISIEAQPPVALQSSDEVVALLREGVEEQLLPNVSPDENEVAGFEETSPNGLEIDEPVRSPQPIDLSAAERAGWAYARSEDSCGAYLQFLSSYPHSGNTIFARMRAQAVCDSSILAAFNSEPAQVPDFAAAELALAPPVAGIDTLDTKTGVIFVGTEPQRPPSEPEIQPEVAREESASERAAWAEASDIGSCLGYSDFLRQFPDSTFSIFARTRARAVCDADTFAEIEQLEQDGREPGQTEIDTSTSAEIATGQDLEDTGIPEPPVAEPAATEVADETAEPQLPPTTIIADSEPTAGNTVSPQADALLSWRAALGEGSCDAFRRFLAEYPDASHAIFARNRLDNECSDERADSVAGLEVADPVDGGIDFAALEVPDLSQPPLDQRLSEPPSFAGLQPLLLPNAATAPNSDLTVFSVTVSRYLDPEVLDLDTEAASSEFANFALLLGVEQDSAFEIDSQPMPLLREALDEFGREVSPGDDVVVFLAGYMASIQSDDFNGTVLLPSDFSSTRSQDLTVSVNGILDTTLSLRELAETLVANSPNSVTIIIESCRGAPMVQQIAASLPLGVDMLGGCLNEPVPGVRILHGVSALPLDGQQTISNSGALLSAMSEVLADQPDLQFSDLRDAVLSDRPTIRLALAARGLDMIVPDPQSANDLESCFRPRQSNGGSRCSAIENSLIPAFLSADPVSPENEEDLDGSIPDLPGTQNVIARWQALQSFPDCEGLQAFLIEPLPTAIRASAIVLRDSRCAIERAAEDGLCSFVAGSGPFALERAGVSALQEELQSLQCWPGGVDGGWGPSTATGLAQAIRETDLDHETLALPNGSFAQSERFTNATLPEQRPTCTTLLEVQEYARNPPSVCTLTCPPGFSEVDGDCERPIVRAPAPQINTAPQTQAVAAQPTVVAPAPAPAPVAAPVAGTCNRLLRWDAGLQRCVPRAGR